MILDYVNNMDLYIYSLFFPHCRIPPQWGHLFPGVESNLLGRSSGRCIPIDICVLQTHSLQGILSHFLSLYKDNVKKTKTNKSSTLLYLPSMKASTWTCELYLYKTSETDFEKKQLVVQPISCMISLRERRSDDLSLEHNTKQLWLCIF